MLTRPQQILLKRAQHEARIDDAEYRQALEMLSKLDGCTSSKDPRLGDDHLDLFMKYFEGIYWHAVDLSQIVHAPAPNAVFRQRDFWKNKNPKDHTSRDRFTEQNLHSQIEHLEAQLNALGCGFQYAFAIRNKIQPFSLWKYKAALERTLAAKQRKAQNA